MNENISFDVARAIEWKRNVDQELEEVTRVLDRVSKLVTTVPGEDDPIIQVICRIGEMEQEAWDGLKRAFAAVSAETNNVISRIGQGITDAVESLTNMKNNFKL